MSPSSASDATGPGTRRNRRRLLLALVAAGALALMSLTTGPSASAQTDPAATDPAADPAASGPDEQFTWGVQPAATDGATPRDAFIYTGRPGQAIADRVAISNFGDEPRTFRLYASDAFNTGDGGFTVTEGDTPSTQVGSWTVLETAEVTVAPGTRVEVPFVVTIPMNAQPGDHAGGVMAEDVSATPTAEEGSTGVAITRRVGSRIYLRVDGPTQPGLAITALSIEADRSVNPFGSSPATVRYTVRNTGNVRIAGDTTVALSGLLGGSIGDPQARLLPELLPGSEATFEATFDDAAGLGRLSAEVTIAAPGAGLDPITRSTSATTVSWLTVVGALVVIAAVVVLVLRRRRARRPVGTAGRGRGGDAAIDLTDPARSTDADHPDGTGPGGGSDHDQLIGTGDGR